MSPLRIDIWSDLACPWCYIGKRRLESAMARCTAAMDFAKPEIEWHAFELNPSAPAQETGHYAQRLAKKYGMSVAEAETRITQVGDLAKAEGLEFHFERIRAGNTFNAHRVIRMAAEQGLQDAAEERLFRAYFCEGCSLAAEEELVRLASEIGMVSERVRQMLRGDSFTSEVRQDEQLAQELGIRGVPFFIFNGKYAVSGAQPAEVFCELLARAQQIDEPLSESSAEDTCTAEHCPT